MLWWGCATLERQARFIALANTRWEKLSNCWARTQNLRGRLQPFLETSVGLACSKHNGDWTHGDIIGAS
jgi:hypothetical protein